MVGEVDYLEVSIKEFVINSLLVMAFIIDAPNTVQTVHSAVISRAKYAAVLFAKPVIPSLIREGHDGKLRNWYGSCLILAHKSGTP